MCFAVCLPGVSTRHVYTRFQKWSFYIGKTQTCQTKLLDEKNNKIFVLIELHYLFSLGNSRGFGIDRLGGFGIDNSRFLGCGLGSRGILFGTSQSTSTTTNGSKRSLTSSALSESLAVEVLFAFQDTLANANVELANKLLGASLDLTAFARNLSLGQDTSTAATLNILACSSGLVSLLVTENSALANVFATSDDALSATANLNLSASQSTLALDNRELASLDTAANELFASNDFASLDDGSASNDTTTTLNGTLSSQGTLLVVALRSANSDSFATQRQFLVLADSTAFLGGAASSTNASLANLLASGESGASFLVSDQLASLAQSASGTSSNANTSSDLGANESDLASSLALHSLASVDTEALGVLANANVAADLADGASLLVLQFLALVNLFASGSTLLGLDLLGASNLDGALLDNSLTRGNANLLGSALELGVDNGAFLDGSASLGGAVNLLHGLFDGLANNTANLAGLDLSHNFTGDTLGHGTAFNGGNLDTTSTIEASVILLANLGGVGTLLGDTAINFAALLTSRTTAANKDLAIGTVSYDSALLDISSANTAGGLGLFVGNLEATLANLEQETVLSVDSATRGTTDNDGGTTTRNTDSLDDSALNNTLDGLNRGASDDSLGSLDGLADSKLDHSLGNFLTTSTASNNSLNGTPDNSTANLFGNSSANADTRSTRANSGSTNALASAGSQAFSGTSHTSTNNPASFEFANSSGSSLSCLDITTEASDNSTLNGFLGNNTTNNFTLGSSTLDDTTNNGTLGNTSNNNSTSSASLGLTNGLSQATSKSGTGSAQFSRISGSQTTSNLVQFSCESSDSSGNSLARCFATGSLGTEETRSSG